MKLAVLSVLTLVALLPAASAASSISLDGFPSKPIEAEGAVAILPFTVKLNVSQAVCVGTGTIPVTVTLAVNLVGPDAANLTTEMPASLEFQVPLQALVSFEDVKAATLVIKAPTSLNHETYVNATVTASLNSGCTAGISAQTQEVSAGVGFEPNPRAIQTAPETEMPGFGLAFGALAIVVVAFLVRRNKA